VWAHEITVLFVGVCVSPLSVFELNENFLLNVVEKRKIPFSWQELNLIIPK
jgi:hypothetical protein